jgi:hypothetical protein
MRHGFKGRGGRVRSLVGAIGIAAARHQLHGVFATRRKPHISIRQRIAAST